MATLNVTLNNTLPMPLNVQFECAPGELVALVGPSGSGKTSVLRAIAGLLKTPSLQGRITLGDTVWFDTLSQETKQTKLSPQNRRVGFVFQNYALFPHLSAIKNIAVAAYNTPASGINVIIQRLGMAGLEQRLPSELSGGQQQRVALARALARQPAVLLLDEPFSAVDAPSRASLYRELAQLRQTVSTPMVLVTHDLQEARRLADRVVILDAGVSLQTGTPEQVFSRPRNARVAEMVGIQNHFQGQFFKHTAQDADGHGLLDWHGCKLNVIDKNKLDDGAHVTWVLATEHLDISMSKPEITTLRASSAEDAAVSCAQNKTDTVLPCQILEVLSLGETSICTLAVTNWPSLNHSRLNLTLSSSQLRGLGMRLGLGLNTLAPQIKAQPQKLWLRIPAHSIHIMPQREHA